MAASNKDNNNKSKKRKSHDQITERKRAACGKKGQAKAQVNFSECLGLGMTTQGEVVFEPALGSQTIPLLRDGAGSVLRKKRHTIPVTLRPFSVTCMRVSRRRGRGQR
jgi:hypothetical protein